MGNPHYSNSITVRHKHYSLDVGHLTLYNVKCSHLSQKNAGTFTSLSGHATLYNIGL